MRAFERRLWRLFDRVIYLSEEEAAIVRELEPAAAARSVVPYSYETFVERETAPRSDTILFVAGFAHAPNVDAAEFLVYQVLPLIQARHPGAKVALVGSHPDWAVSALASPDVEVTGWVSEEDLMQRYRRSRVAVAPLRFGAGVKGKVVQALQQGLPVVVTPVGAQGIPGLDRIVPVREEPQEIAAAVLTLLADDAAWMAQSVAQSRFAEAHYSRAAMRVSLLRALQPTD
jgi:glycosyltransferase involved in cell wall biosynthesis